MRIEESLEYKQLRIGTDSDDYREVIPGHNDVREDMAGKRINVIFVGVNDTTEGIEQKTRRAVGCDPNNHGLLSIDAIRTNLDKFNFWYVTKSAKVASYAEGWDQFGGEAYNQIIPAASVVRLPRRAIVGFVNWYFRSNAGLSSLSGLNLEQMDLSYISWWQDDLSNMDTARCEDELERICNKMQESSYYPDNPKQNPDYRFCQGIHELRGKQDPELDKNICNLIIKGGDIPFGIALVSSVQNFFPITTAHEMMHSFIGLRDEYVEETLLADPVEDLKSLRLTPINCFPADSKNQCLAESPWADLIGTTGAGCYQGCSYTNELAGVPVWRSAQADLMNVNYTDPTYLGPWNEKRVCLALQAAVQHPGGVCKRYGFTESEPVHSLRIENLFIMSPVRTDISGHEIFLDNPGQKDPKNRLF